MEATATILGIPNQPTITEVNVRQSRTINSEKKFTAPVGMGMLKITRVRADKDGSETDGKLHFWIKVEFPGGTGGWVRDDLVQIEGDCAIFGYSDGLPKTRAFDLTIDPTVRKPGPAEPDEVESVAAPAIPAVPSATAVPAIPSAPVAPASPVTPTTHTPASTVKKFEASGRVRVRSKGSLSGTHLGWVEATTVIEVDPNSRTEADGYIWWNHSGGWSAEKSTNGQQIFLQAPLVIGGPVVPISSRVGFDDLNRIKLASYAITGAFEGSGYAAYNNYDAGIISYGFIQFTMAAGSMITVVQRYLSKSQTDVANKLRAYLPRIEAKDGNLRNDGNLKNLLIAAANEQIMIDAQHSVAEEKYWDKVWKGYIEPRGLTTPLGIALLFDMGVNFGTGHGFVRKAEEQLGVRPQSKPGQNGISEEQLIQRVAELRKASHDKQAKEQNLFGLMQRGNFWVRLINNGDWGLQAESSGTVNIRGKIVQVRNP
jgi:hypothetical protein